MKKSRSVPVKGKKPQVDMKYLAVIGVLGIILIVLVVLILTRFAGCGKSGSEPILLYSNVEGSDTQVTITGLTDKGASMEKITIPSKIEGKDVTAISREAFRDSAALKEVHIEEGITRIEENAFFNCKILEVIDIPSTVKHMGTNAVKNTKWEDQRLAESDYIVVNGILITVKAGKDTYEVPQGVTLIASGVFYNNSSVRKIVLPDTLSVIGDYGFAGCTALEEVSVSGASKDINLPSTLTDIGYAAFAGCKELVITVPNTVNNVGVDAFLDVKSVEGKYEIK